MAKEALRRAGMVRAFAWANSRRKVVAFDRIHWPTLWVALREQGVPEHLVCLLENAYAEQIGEVMGEWGQSRRFSITGGVRQDCVLSPRLFSAVLQWALQQWTTEIGHAGFLGDNLGNLVDLRFADDIMLFANSGPEVAEILDKFAKAVGKVGLRLNIDKTVILTNEAVNGQRSTLHARLGSLFQAQGTYVKLLPIYISACRSLKTQEALNTTNPDPWPPSPMKGKSLKRQKFPSMLSQECFGRPTRLRPQGFQCKTRLSHRWSGSNAK